MIEKINNNQVPDILKELSARQPSSSGTPAKTESDALLQVSYDAVIERAKQFTPDDAGAVNRARELLLSGQLDSPEFMRAAAEAMVRFGI
ncbi:MAG: hypothetical protein WC476_04905 [Phycisphaerae bacterium]|jgi:hypothetical protein